MTDPQPLPDTLPLFPLPGVLLLPHGCLPLHVFEPRYRSLIRDAMETDKLIGMVQTVDAHDDLVPDDARLYEVGCSARITEFNETDDGRFLITICGVSRFHIQTDEPTEAGYRRARVTYAGFERDSVTPTPAETEAERQSLMHAIDEFFEVADDGADWAAIAEANTVDLLTSLAMISPLEARDKQALLECPTTAERQKLLVALMDMAANGDNSPTTQTQ